MRYCAKIVGSDGTLCNHVSSKPAIVVAACPTCSHPMCFFVPTRYLVGPVPRKTHGTRLNPGPAWTTGVNQQRPRQRGTVAYRQYNTQQRHLGLRANVSRCRVPAMPLGDGREGWYCIPREEAYQAVVSYTSNERLSNVATRGLDSMQPYLAVWFLCRLDHCFVLEH